MTFQVELEGQRIEVTGSDYERVQRIALVIFGMTPDVHWKRRKQAAAWSLARAKQIVGQLKQEIGIMDGDRNGGAA